MQRLEDLQDQLEEIEAQINELLNDDEPHVTPVTGCKHCACQEPDAPTFVEAYLEASQDATLLAVRALISATASGGREAIEASRIILTHLGVVAVD